MEYIRATVSVGPSLYRVYCHHGARINVNELSQFFNGDENLKHFLAPSYDEREKFTYIIPQIINVVAVDDFDIDDPLKVVMIDESGIYFW